MNYDLFLTFERIVRAISVFETDSLQKRKTSSATWLLLKYISEGTAITGSDVAERFMIKPPTASQLIERAVKQGFIDRKPSEYDRRVYHLVLTTIGEKQLQQLSELFDKRASRALKYLSGDERAQLNALMNKMATGLQKELDVKNRGQIA